jgi:hypothetical protein
VTRLGDLSTGTHLPASRVVDLALVVSGIPTVWGLVGCLDDDPACQVEPARHSAHDAEQRAGDLYRVKVARSLTELSCSQARRNTHRPVRLMRATDANHPSSRTRSNLEPARIGLRYCERRPDGAWPRCRRSTAELSPPPCYAPGHLSLRAPYPRGLVLASWSRLVEGPSAWTVPEAWSRNGFHCTLTPAHGELPKTLRSTAEKIKNVGA